MKGNVIGFDPDTNSGAISGYDGQRYDFATVDWHGQSQPRHGDIVDFQTDGRRATQIYLVEPQYVAPSFGQFYFSPSGRISRSQYWLKFMLPYIGISVVLQIIAAASGPGSALYVVISIILFIFSLVALWPSIAILVKRIHDRNKSGWLCLVLYIPTIIFIILLFVWLAAILIAVAAGSSASAPSIGAFGVVVLILGLACAGIGIWFFVEFGCLRGTIGANRFGPDPVR
jgi:uncharacterized membrane protein YhaH (DUF805 family)